MFVIILSIVNFIGLGGFVYFYYKGTGEKKRGFLLLKEIRSQLNSILSDFDQATNRNVSILEMKINELNQVLLTADKRIVLLNDKIKKDSAVKEIYTHLEENLPIQNRIKVQSEFQFENQPKEKKLSDSEVQSTEHFLGEELADKSKKIPFSGIKNNVLYLFKTGLSVKEIANKLSITQSEVNLIISLKQPH